MATAAEFAARVRAQEQVLGYWLVLDAPPAVERIAGTGYDCVVFDGQHGLIEYRGLLAGLTAVDAAARAVGLVMNRNPIPVVLPCHRIVGASGSLVGYGGGLDLKEQLLRHEGVTL